MQPWMKLGLALGVAMCIWTMAEYLLGFHTTRIAWGQVSSYVALVMPLAFIVAAGRAQRRRAPETGVGGYLATAVLVMLVSYCVLIPFQLAYHHYINPQWLERLLAYQREKLVLAGTAPDQIDTKLRAFAAASSDRAQVIGGLIGSVVVGLLIGLPAALVLRRRGAPSATAEAQKQTA